MGCDSTADISIQALKERQRALNEEIEALQLAIRRLRIAKARYDCLINSRVENYLVDDRAIPLDHEYGQQRLSRSLLVDTAVSGKADRRLPAPNTGNGDDTTFAR